MDGKGKAGDYIENIINKNIYDENFDEQSD